VVTHWMRAAACVDRARHFIFIFSCHLFIKKLKALECSKGLGFFGGVHLKHLYFFLVVRA
jgi:hypothetical protein